MALTPSWPGASGLATTTDARKNLAGLIARNTSGVARAGLFPAHLNAIVTARTDMNVDIAAFVGAAVQFGGPVLIANDGVAQLPSVLVSPGSGTNYYVIYAKQNEATAPGTDANDLRVFGAQLSTTSLAVARAALPTGALELATVEMPTGKTATNQGGVVITQTAPFTAAAGGDVWVRNSTDRDAWTPASGSKAFQIDTGISYERVGSIWLPVLTSVTMRKTSTQDLASGVETDLTWTTVGVNAGFTLGGLPISSITIPAAGDYEISATADASQTAGNYFNLSAYLDAVVLLQITGSVYPHTGAFSRATIPPVGFSATAGQVVKVTGLTSSAGTISANSAILTLKRLR